MNGTSMPAGRPSPDLAPWHGHSHPAGSEAGETRAPGPLAGLELAQARNHQAQIELRLHHPAAAAALAAEALAAAPHTPAAVAALTLCGLAAEADNRLLEADQLLNQAAALGRELGDLAGAARALQHLALAVHLPRGQPELALAAMQSAAGLSVHGPGIFPWGLALVQFILARQEGDLARARECLAGLPALEPADPLLAAMRQLLRAQLALDEDDFETAEPALERCAAFLGAAHPPEWSLWYRLERSRLSRRRGAFQSALHWAEDGLRFAQRLKHLHYCGQAHQELARVHWQMQALDQAAAALAAARRSFETAGSAYHLAHAALLLALLQSERSDAQAPGVFLEAARLVRAGGHTGLLETEREQAFPFLVGYARHADPAVSAAADSLLALLVRAAPPPLRVYGLGLFRVFRGRRAIPAAAWEQRRAGALFRLLLIQPRHTMRREALMEALWPDQPAAAARQKLHHATSALRRALEPDLPDKFPSRYLSVEADSLSLHLPAGSTVDFEVFQAGYLQRSANLAEVLGLYHGDLFPGAVESEWAEVLRERLRRWYVQGLLQLAEQRLTLGQPAQAFEYAARVLEREPWSEDAVWIGMRACAAQNNRPAGLRLYRKLAAHLSAEYKLAPRPEITALAARLSHAAEAA